MNSQFMWTRFWLFEAKRPRVWLRLVWFTLWHWTLLRFALVGGLSVLAGLSTLWLLTEVVGLYYLASNVLAFVVSTLCWYSLHKAWTFKDRQSKFGLLKSFPTRLLVLGLNTGLLALFTEVCGLWYMASAALAILLSFPVSYGISTKWIWSNEKETA